MLRLVRAAARRALLRRAALEEQGRQEARKSCEFREARQRSDGVAHALGVQHAHHGFGAQHGFGFGVGRQMREALESRDAVRREEHLEDRSLGKVVAERERDEQSAAGPRPEAPALPHRRIASRCCPFSAPRPHAEQVERSRDGTTALFYRGGRQRARARRGQQVSPTVSVGGQRVKFCLFFLSSDNLECAVELHGNNQRRRSLPASIEVWSINTRESYLGEC